MDSPRKILIVCNTTAATFNFRAPYIISLKKQGYIVSCLSFAQHRFAEELSEICNGESYVISKPAIFFSILKIKSIINSVDVVHSFTHIANLISLLFCKRNHRVLCTVTGLGRLWSSSGLVTNFLRYVVCGCYRLCYKRAKVFIFQNELDRKYFIEEVFLSSSPPIIYTTPGSGVDFSRYNSVAEKKFSNKIERIGFFSRADQLKGVGDFYWIADKLREIQFVHAGHPGNGTFSQNAINSTAAKFGVEYLGVLSYPETEIAKCDLVFIPSRYREGVPRLLLECFVLGIPTISYGGAGLSDHVVDAFNSFIVKDKEEALNLIKSLSTKQLQNISINQKKYAVEIFSSDKVNDIYFEALSQTIGN